MKKTLSNFLVVVLSNLLIVSCGHKTQPIISSIITLKPIETLAPTIKPTATFLPTFTPAPFLLSLFPTQTLTPLPKDIFDNFQGLSGSCRIKIEGGATTSREGILNLYSNISINFDKQEYSPDDPIMLSASVNEDDNETQHLHGIVAKVIVEEPKLGRYSFPLYDDGNHGDEKADDGVYTSIFDNTLNTGIYKFYFQLTNKDKNTREIFTRECFLAKTVKITPVTVEEDKSCRRTEASTPVIVGAEDVGGSGISQLGAYAFHPKAVSIGTGVLATWFTGFDGQAPEPNAYMRLLDDNVSPIGNEKLLFERNRTGQSYSLVKKDDYAILTYCGRYKVGNHYEDRITSAFLDSNGHLVSEQVRSPTNRVCSYAGGESVWTGSHLLFTWTDVNSSSFNPDLLLDIADPNGNSISWKSVSSGASTNPHLAIGHEHVSIVVTTRTGQLEVHSFDLEGNEVGEPVLLSPLTYEVNGEIVVGNFQTPYVVPTANGWMVLAALKPSGIYVAHLTPDGTLVSEPFITNNNLYFANGFTDVISYEGGAAILGDNIVLFLSDKGGVYQQWYPKQNEHPSFGSFFIHQGRLYLIYTGTSKSGNSNDNQVLVRELQCIP